jgi:hypothetical protein
MQMRSASGRGEQKMFEPVPGASPLLRTDDVATGWLGVQGRVRLRGRTGRFDDFFAPGFVLLGRNADPSRDLPTKQRAFQPRAS